MGGLFEFLWILIDDDFSFLFCFCMFIILCFSIFGNFWIQTSPFHWYFTSAIPRAIGFPVILSVFGIIWERRLLYLAISNFIFLILYSYLPHKELRFIIYTFPSINLFAASAFARLFVFLIFIFILFPFPVPVLLFLLSFSSHSF